MNKILTLLLTACMLSLHFVSAQTAGGVSSVLVPTVAVLPFEACGRQAETSRPANPSPICSSSVWKWRHRPVEQLIWTRRNELHLSAVG